MEKIKCPECKKKLSIKAIICPKCGCPISETQANKASADAETKCKRKRILIASIFVGVIFVIILTLLLAFSFNSNKTNNSNKINLETLDNAMVKIVCYDPFDNIISTGSGFFYKDDSHIVTNYHVIAEAYKIEYITNDEKKYNIECIYYYSSKMDIAVLVAKNPVNEYNYLKAGNSNVEKGTKVFAIGSPLGIQNVLSDGIVSGNYMIDGINTIQFTAPISSGSSGGALVNAKGKVIGITFASSEAGQNINLAIPIELLERTCPEWNNSMELNIPELYRKNHPWGLDVCMLKTMNKEIQVVSFDELKKNTKLYKGKTVAFEAYVSSIYNNNIYFVTNKNNVTGNFEYDLVEHFDNSDKDSPYICVQTFGDENPPDHIDDIEYDSKVWVVASPTGNDYDSCMLLLLYDESNNTYVSSIPSIANALLEMN